MKPKKTIILTFAILYGLLSFLLFSDTFFIKLIEIQKEYHLRESENFETMIFSIENWEKLDDKKEFKRNGQYYDVKKIKVGDKKVTATVIKDEYENFLKYVSKNIFPKNKKQKNSKQKRILQASILYSATHSIQNFKANIKHNYPNNIMCSKLLPQNIYRPPRLF